MGYGEYNAADFNQKEADRGFKIAYQGVARIVSEGDQLARGVSPSEIAAQQMRAGATIETAIDLNFSVVEFVFCNLEFLVLVLSCVEIEYVGEPIYVPPSANPAYVPPKKLNTKG